MDDETKAGFDIVFGKFDYEKLQEDVHLKLAKEVFGVDKPTREQRANIKEAVFGLQHGVVYGVHRAKDAKLSTGGKAALRRLLGLEDDE